MKIFLITLLTFTTTIIVCNGQADLQQKDTIQKKDVPYITEENMPEYPGGQAAMYNFINTHIHYPKRSRKKGIQGKIYVSFTVEIDGSLSDIKVVKGVSNGEELSDEAIRVLKLMPNWKPGSMEGKAVKVKFTIPFNFSLS